MFRFLDWNIGHVLDVSFCWCLIWRSREFLYYHLLFVLWLTGNDASLKRDMRKYRQFIRSLQSFLLFDLIRLESLWTWLFNIIRLENIFWNLTGLWSVWSLKLTWWKFEMMEVIITCLEKFPLAICVTSYRLHWIEFMLLINFKLWILEWMIVIINFNFFIKLSCLKSDLCRVLILDFVLAIYLKKLLCIPLLHVLVCVMLVELRTLLLFILMSI